jgi:UDP-N-acetyl-2-amino-2-deoxyglucuronate dehydrogenase
VVQASTALWPGTDIRLEINGSDGIAIVFGERIDTWKFKTEHPEDETIRKIGRIGIETAATGPAAFSHQDHQFVIEDMVDAILEDRDPCIPLPATRGTLEIALAMYQSAKLGDCVNLPIQNENDVWG